MIIRVSGKFSWKYLVAPALAMSLVAGTFASSSRAALSSAGFGLRVFVSPSIRVPRSSPASPAGAPSIFAPDKGKLRITINGQQVGSEDFELY